jgi:hypothetical protein
MVERTGHHDNGRTGLRATSQTVVNAALRVGDNDFVDTYDVAESEIMRR